VIRNAVVHIMNEQPLLADLHALPQASDVGLLCTNLRAMDGKRPVFIDHSENAFFFPYRVIRFVEIPAAALERHRDDGGRAALPAASPPEPTGGDEPDGSDADGGGRAALGLPAPAWPAPAAAGLAPDPDDEIDEEFLRRIREV